MSSASVLISAIRIKLAVLYHRLLFYYAWICLNPTGCKAHNVTPDQTPQNAASDQGLHCLLSPVSPNTLDKNVT